MKTILSIETSCDETGIAVIRGIGKARPDIHIVANELASQIAIHRKYGGVVPHLAAREHEKNLPIVLRRVLAKAKKRGVRQNNIDIIAVTKGPGLAPALWRGIKFAKDLAQKWNKPLMGIDHMEGHLCANFIAGEMNTHLKFKARNSKLVQFPALCLTVSGGHTQLVLLKKWTQYELLGETLDDAAGEAFDKVARMLGLAYPGGPHIGKLAAKGDVSAFPFPRPMIQKKNYNFSFSGLKTAVLYTIRDLPKKNLTAKKKRDIAASFQQAVIDVLVAKTIRAAREYNTRTVMLAGGVAANKELRMQMEKAVIVRIPNSSFQLPDPRLCTDNAAMIGAAAYIHLAHGKKPNADIDAEPARQITDY